MDDLTAFLNARLDDDEAAANEVHRPRDCGSVDRDGSFDPDPIWCSCDYPARVLREVAAGRKLLALLEQDVTDGRERDYEATEVLEQVARIRAAVYGDHPAYRPQWKP